VVNGFMFLRVLPPARWRRVAFTWSILGLVLIAPFTPPGARGLLGYWNGFKTLVGSMATEDGLC